MCDHCAALDADEECQFCVDREVVFKYERTEEGAINAVEKMTQ